MSSRTNLFRRLRLALAAVPAALFTVWARIWGFIRRRDLDREFLEELESHLAMAEAEKIRSGLSPAEARRQARIELGGLTQVREAGRRAQGLPWLETLGLDFKLGLRMLRKSWGLTLVGGLAMTLAIGIAVTVFSLIDGVFSPTLPLEDGDRVVAIQTWNDKEGRREVTTTADFGRWRQRLRSFENVGAFRSVKHNLESVEGHAAPVTVAEMSASGFTVTRVAPLLGRPLVAADEEPGAPPVAVLGYDLWRTRFAGDVGLVGQTLRLGDRPVTVVGVMPEGFAFPVNHSLWTPLQIDPNRDPPLETDGPGSVIFARLRADRSFDAAATELAALGLDPNARAGGALGVSGDPESGEASVLRPRLVPYTFAFTGNFERGELPWVLRVVMGVLILLLVPPCANIAILVYARMITRQEEFASRFALGASRGRIVAQIFVEVLVLATLASLVALWMAHYAGQRALSHMVSSSGDGGLPFWIDFSLTWRTVVFAAALAVVAAAIAGVAPAFKATGRKMQASFRALGSGHAVQLGWTWTVLVVAQVALTLASLPTAVQIGWGTVRPGLLGPGFDAEEFLTAELGAIDPDGSAELDSPRLDADSARARLETLEAELARALEQEAGVVGVSFAHAVPGAEPWAVVEVEGLELEREGIVESRDVVQWNSVDASFFDLFDAAPVLGRGFEAADFEGVSKALIVDQTFAAALLADRNPLGQRVRYSRTVDEAWIDPTRFELGFEIVGVVPDLPAHGGKGTIYHPRQIGGAVTSTVSIRAGYDPELLAPRLRELTTELDPWISLEAVRTLDDIYTEQHVGNNIGATSLAAITLSVLLLSAAGIYALLSFTVNQRRREIGIRAALGAQPHRLLFGIFRRSLAQIGAGVTVGAVLAAGLEALIPVEQVGGWQVPGIIAWTGLVMLTIGLLAAAGPAGRGLRVDPIEELREG
ncbi:MAG: ABC transporter permease [Acidobacteriota bacterium]